MSVIALDGHAEEREIGDVNADDRVVREILDWSGRDQSLKAPLMLMSKRAYDVLCRLQGSDARRFEFVSAQHQKAVARHFSKVLREIAEGREPSGDDLSMLANTMAVDPIQSAFLADADRVAVQESLRERIQLIRRLWRPFLVWWHAYFPNGTERGDPSVDLWQLYIPFGQWILREKRRRRASGLFVIGFNGSPGAGKTVLANALAVVLNHLLDPETEGQAIARSGDDWYLSKRDREGLRALGYDPGTPGLSNRAPPGTHDREWLERNLIEMELSDQDSVIRMGNFDKKIDDQPDGADRYYEVRGKVGVFLFDLWFAGAEAVVDPTRLPVGLKRKVAENLREWRTIFDRLDALWMFEWPSLDRVLEEREAQEHLVEQRHGRRGISREDLMAFIRYMISQCWDWETMPPFPPERAITFRARRDAHHRVIGIERGGRVS
ncbi:kinase-like protein [Nitrospirillum iridis]|uniref:Pantothenate kinase-related protein Tda10 n=1 Tax=Nitrospirillum iridis TaxID=765888 RepID=A0A7X0EF32_9PROT|nr:kinase-like protein [Nitrospirillum iridis]MBB6254547.1 pantothenate kinase-related protein Tda10 [Nitrospirillum iridis]